MWFWCWRGGRWLGVHGVDSRKRGNGVLARALSGAGGREGWFGETWFGWTWFGWRGGWCRGADAVCGRERAAWRCPCCGWVPGSCGRCGWARRWRAWAWRRERAAGGVGAGAGGGPRLGLWHVVAGGVERRAGAGCPELFGWLRGCGDAGGGAAAVAQDLAGPAGALVDLGERPFRGWCRLAGRGAWAGGAGDRGAARARSG